MKPQMPQDYPVQYCGWHFPFFAQLLFVFTCKAILNSYIGFTVWLVWHISPKEISDELFGLKLETIKGEYSTCIADTVGPSMFSLPAQVTGERVLLIGASQGPPV